jgi:hypothetical protein
VLELEGFAVSTLEVARRSSATLVGHRMGDQKFIISSSVLAAFTVVRTHPHWTRVVVYCTFSLCVIHKEALCSSSGDINRLMMKLLCTVNSTSHCTPWTLYRSYLKGINANIELQVYSVTCC